MCRLSLWVWPWPWSYKYWSYSYGDKHGLHCVPWCMFEVCQYYRLWHCADLDKHYRGFIVKHLDASSNPKKLLQSVKICNTQLVWLYLIGFLCWFIINHFCSSLALYYIFKWKIQGCILLSRFWFFPPCLRFFSPWRVASYFYVCDFLPHIAIKQCS